MSIKGHLVRTERIVPDIEQLPRPVYARNESLARDSQTVWHQHDWIQITYAIRGMLTVYTESGSYVVPPMWAVWIPNGVRHQVNTSDRVEMRGLYIEASAACFDNDAAECRVFEVTPLLRELICTFCALPVLYDIAGEQGRLVQVLLDQLRAAKTVEWSLPMPTDPRLKRLCDELQLHPDDQRTLVVWGQLLGASEKTLSRLFLKQTGLSFRIWRQRLRLFSALRRLESGEKVTSVALASGYDSTSSFIAAFRAQFGMTPGEVF